MSDDMPGKEVDKDTGKITDKTPEPKAEDATQHPIQRPPEDNMFESYLSRDGLKRAIVPAVALIFSVIFAVLWLSHSAWWLLGLFVSVPLVLIGLYDATQANWTLMRNYPVAARIRWLFYDLRPYLRAYIVEGDLEGKPFSIEARNLVQARARGETDTNPFGTKLDTDADDYEWINHSIVPAHSVDVDARVTVGGKDCTQPYDASVFNISAMSFGSLSAHAIEALNLGAKMGGYYHDTGEGGISPYHLKHSGDLVWELGSGYFGCRDDKGHFDAALFADNAQRPEVKMTEIKLSQGAKPGHGGMLPGAKVTEEIAETRRVPQGVDCISPRRHSAFSTPIELLEFAQKMRELSGGKPVGIKLCVGHMHEVMAIMKAMLKTGIRLDYIVVDGAEGGTGAAPLELSNHVGVPMTEGLIAMRNALVGTGLKDEVKLAAAGKVFSASGLARNFAIGADWCNAARAFMFSIGCVQSLRCHLGSCPTGIATQDPGRQHGLVVPVQAERSARFHRKTLEALADMVAAAGFDHPSGLSPHHLMQRTNAVDAHRIDHIYPFLKTNQLIDDPDSTAYAQYWRMASAESFITKG